MLICCSKNNLDKLVGYKKGKNVLTSAKACNYLFQNGFNIKFNVGGKIEDKREFNNIVS